jgi:hypothetical protein
VPEGQTLESSPLAVLSYGKRTQLWLSVGRWMLAPLLGWSGHGLLLYYILGIPTDDFTPFSSDGQCPRAGEHICSITPGRTVKIPLGWIPQHISEHVLPAFTRRINTCGAYCNQHCHA